MVVIAIIAILAVVVVLTLNPAQLLAQSRDANRLSDLATLNSAINLYNTDQSGASTYSLGLSSTTYVSIPDPTASATCGGLGGNFTSGGYFTCGTATSSRAVNGTGWIPINFNAISAGSPIGALPVDPVNNTSSNLYYSYQTNGSTFRLVATPESQKYLASAGQNPMMFVTGSNTTLDGGYWVPVPGNSAFGTSDFYVMKYDASCSDGNGNVVNTPTDPSYPGGYDNATTNCAHVAALPGGNPIVDIAETTAKASCAAIGAHLMTNDEYMTIVMNAESQGSNWTGGAVGTGGMYLGNANNASEYPADPSDANGYSNGTGGTMTNQTVTNTGDERRTYTLSNGSVVWDMSGNVWEEVQRSSKNAGDNTATITPPTCSNGTAGWEWCQWNSTAPYVTAYNDSSFSAATVAPPNSSWTSAQGMGQLYTYGSGANQGTNAFVRGGYWSNGANAGPFTLILIWGAGSTNAGVGFRCAR